jgi:hypothetical protein
MPSGVGCPGALGSFVAGCLGAVTGAAVGCSCWGSSIGIGKFLACATISIA